MRSVFDMKKTILSALIVCMMFMSACTKPEKGNDEAVDLGEGIVLKVGGTEMTSSQFSFFLDDIKNQMQGTELSEDASWETTEIEGKKAIDIAKERAYKSAVQYLSSIEIAKKMGLSYTDDEMKNLKSQIKAAYFDQYEDSEDLMNLVCESMLYMNKLQKKMVEEESVSDSDIKAYFDEHKEELESQYMRAKHVLFLTQDPNTKEPLSAEEIAKKKKSADDVLARAKNGEDFDTLVSTYSEDPGSKSNPDGYVFTSGEMVKDFEDCVKSLKPGEIGFVESSYGYHIIKRLELDADSCKSVISNALYTEKFEKYIEGLTEKYKITVTKNTEEYNKIK